MKNKNSKHIILLTLIESSLIIAVIYYLTYNKEIGSQAIRNDILGNSQTDHYNKGVSIPENVLTREIVKQLYFSGECFKTSDGKFIEDTFVIPPKYTKIDERAFSFNTSDQTKIDKIKLPEAMTEIDKWAFEGCQCLTEIELPEGIKTIGAGAFSDCIRLKKIKLPQSLKEIGRAAFWDCSSLTEIEIPSGVSSIGVGIFEGCRSLKKIIVYKPFIKFINKRLFIISQWENIREPIFRRFLCQYPTKQAPKDVEIYINERVKGSELIKILRENHLISKLEYRQD